ncbi:PadR family transcriptional regulator [Paenibacillus sp.]|uniref:PadR family transcriptional regulator n=1 Tax=Paenibacillus sp. TaxID=58172 RepID=UPI0028A75507|nr:PadR family transcriptional regulator [Paenibacillus sp.]
MDIEVLILAQLMKGSKHGYEIKKNIIFVMGNDKIVNNNSLYPKLKLFEKRGWVIKKTEMQERRPNRYVYSITVEGEERFHICLNEFSLETIRIDNEWSIRLAYYELLDLEARRRLLDYRETYMKEKLEHLQQLSLVIGNGEDLDYSEELYFYTRSMVMREIELIKELSCKLESIKGLIR